MGGGLSLRMSNGFKHLSGKAGLFFTIFDNDPTPGIGNFSTKTPKIGTF